ncbi:hypothetical protein FACS1894141_1010 [Spirochaetia bacterium]|nr:hypothetical protein FACS1894141_1010 [Spirochaetia bacterium]
MVSLDGGRKGFAADGKEHDGRLSYEDGISTAMSSFQEAQTLGDCETLILAEQAFLEQELHFCHDNDVITRNSLTQAIQDFEDALRCLKTIEVKTLYQAAETTYSTTKNRIQGCPRDIANLWFDSPGLRCTPDTAEQLPPYPRDQHDRKGCYSAAHGKHENRRKLLYRETEESIVCCQIA